MRRMLDAPANAEGADTSDAKAPSTKTPATRKAGTVRKPATEKKPAPKKQPPMDMKMPGMDHSTMPGMGKP